MPGIILKPGQALDQALRIFKKQLEKSGVLKDLKKKKHFEKPSIRKKKKSKEARRRLSKQNRKLGLE
tara:strand:- start:399 stop:599 length:201 start_codon:yes stop_codon:yes gene_type:complete